MADRIRRHALFLSDREIRLVDRTLLIYLALLRIIQVVGSKRESNDIAHITRLVVCEPVTLAEFAQLLANHLLTGTNTIERALNLDGGEHCGYGYEDAGSVALFRVAASARTASRRWPALPDGDGR